MILIILKYILIGSIAFIILDTFYFICILPKPKTHNNNFKYYNKFFYNVFRLLPRRIAEYIISLSSNEFNQSGMIIYCGAQGEGKSYAMTHEMHKIYCKFPQTKYLCNYWTVLRDKKMDDWHPLLYEKNGDNGIIFAFDEISLWFNSRFRSLDPSCLGELVQNRKNHRAIFGTAQNISMVDKQLRMQCTEYRNCHCWFGFFIWCSCWRPVFDFDGDLTDKKFLGFKFYMQDDVIRYSYDTFETQHALFKNGFNYEKPVDVNISIKGDNICKKKLKKF